MARLISIFLIGIFTPVLGVQVSIPNAEESAGKTFELPIQVGALTGQNITQFQFTIMFNPSVLIGIAISQDATLTATWAPPATNISEGAFQVSASGNTALTGSGSLIKLVFKVQSHASAGTSIPLSFTSFKFNDGNPSAELQNGVFLVIQDTEAPVITNGPIVENISANAATIFWETNEPTNGRVEYGRNQSLELSKSQSQFSEEHRISLTNLTPAQLYYYRISSADRAGNGPVSSKINSFFTSNIINSLGVASGDPGSEVIVPLNISDVTGLGVIDIKANVKFDPEILRFSRISIENTLTANWRLPRYSVADGNLRIEAQGGAALTGSGTIAHLIFQINARARVGRKVTLFFEKSLLNNGLIQVTPENGELTVLDTQPPAFIGTPFVEKITASGVVIRWETSERATSRLLCGENSQHYDIQKISNALVTDHWMELNGLKPDTRYYFQISAADSSGNGPVLSAEQSFQTDTTGIFFTDLPDLSISKGAQFQIPLRFQNAENSQITKWFCAIRYNPDVLRFVDVSAENTLISAWPKPITEALGDLLIIHARGDSALKGSGDLLKLNFLAANDVGHSTQTELEIKHFIVNEGFPLVTTGNATLSLNNIADPTPPEITFGPIVDDISGTKATVFWMTNLPATSEVQYGADSNYGRLVRSETQTTVHQLTVTDLSPYNFYHFRVRSAARTGSTPVTSENVRFFTSGGREVRLRVPDFNLPPGSIFEVPVKIYGVAGLAVNQVEFTLNYDPELALAGTATSSGTLTESWGAPFFSSERGKIHVQLTGSLVLPDSGTIVKIQFEVLQKSQFRKVTPLYFSDVNINQGTHEKSSRLGLLTVIDGSIPLITRQPQSEILTPGSSVITWETDEPATTIIEYGTSQSYGQQLRSDYIERAHIAQLTNLEPNTIYYYRVGGTDEYGNGPNFTARKILQTPARAPFVLSLPEVGYALNQLFWLSVTINGAGPENEIYAADFILKFDPGALKYQQATGIGALTRNWNIVVKQLTDSTLAVHLDGISSITEEGTLVRLQFLPYNSRRFGEQTKLILENSKINESTEGVNVLNGYFTLRENPYPVITFGPGASKLSQNSAQIYWITNHPSNSKIEYGLSENYDYSLLNNNYVKYHAIDLFGLKPDTEYHFKVSSVDEYGRGPAVSEDFVFTTSKGNQVVVSLPDTSVAIGKTFSIPILIENTAEKNLQQFTFEAEFDSTLVSPGGLSTDGTLCQNWEVKITRLTPSLIAGTVTGIASLTGSGKLIKIQGIANAQAEPGETSPALLKKINFNYGLVPGSTTNGSLALIDQNAPQFIQFPAIKRTFLNSAILQWETDKPTSAIVAFGADSVIDSQTKITSLAKKHEFNLSNLYSETVYACRVGIYDSQGSGPVWSNIFYFETQSKPIRLTIPELTMEVGKLIQVPVHLSGISGTAVRAFNFTLNFDGSKLVPISVNHANSLAGEWAAPDFSTGIHELSVSANGKTRISEDGTLVWLSFKAHPLAVPGEKGWLTFQHVQINEDIDTTRTDTTWFSLAAPVSDDSVAVVLPDTTLAPGAWCLYPVRISDIGSRAIFNGNFEIAYDASVLSCGGAMRAGKMLSFRTNLTNQFGTNRLQVAFETPDQLVGSGVLLRILFRIRPDAPLGSQIKISLKKFRLNSGEIPIKRDDGSFTLFQYPDIVTGFVVERDSLNPVSGATVTLLGENNQEYRTLETDRIGRFVFPLLDVTQQDSYKVKVTKAGYSGADSAVGVVAGAHQLRLVLLQPDGKIAGKITTPNGFPIHGAAVTASDFKGDDAAHFATTISDAAGFFELPGLNRIEPFRLTVQKNGFRQLVLNRLFADTTIWCVPDADYSTLSGSVNLPGEQPLANALVTITDNETLALFDSVRTDANGQFVLENLVVGSYSLSPSKPGFLTTGAETIEIGPGQQYTVTLQMQQGILDHFEITGKDFIANNGRARYRFNAWATVGEKMELPDEPRWRINPPVAGNFEKSLFFPNPNYFCDAWIVLETADSTRKDSLRINLFAPLSPDSDIELKDYQGFLLEILPGSVTEDTLIYTTRGDLPEIQRIENSWKVIGYVYDLQPHELYFEQPVSMHFPLQSESDSLDVRLGHWDFQRGKWFVLPDVLFSDQMTLTTSINRGGLYAQLDASQELGVYDIRLVPNPFSPDFDTDGDGEPGLAIHFLVSSKASTRPFLTLKIYNLLGELVRELMVREPVEKVQEMVVRWDGLTDHQLKARNGRYLLRMILEDGSGKKEYLKKIVLIK